MKIGVWNGSQTMWDSFQTSIFNTENLSFIGLWNPTCVHRLMLAYASFNAAYVGSCLRMQAEGFLWPLFPKIDFVLIKKLYFPFYHISSQFVIWLGLKPTLGLRILASLENGGLSHKGYKMRCLHLPRNLVLGQQ